MTASAKIRGADKIVVNFGDKMLVLDAEEAIALHADLSRISDRAVLELAR